MNNPLAVALLVLAFCWCSTAFTPATKSPVSFRNRVLALQPLFATDSAASLKSELLSSIRTLKDQQERDGDFSIDFGVKGGELNSTSRAPQKVDYYAISEEVGKAADKVMKVCDSLADNSPTEEPTKYLGDKVNGTMAPLHGAWKLLFTTAADASFSKNSTRGEFAPRCFIGYVRNQHLSHGKEISPQATPRHKM